MYSLTWYILFLLCSSLPPELSLAESLTSVFLSIICWEHVNFSVGPPSYLLFFPIISIICPLPTSEALPTFLGIWYSSTSLPITKISFSFLCCYNKLPQSRWLKTVELFFSYSFVGQKSKISITELKRRFCQNHSVSARFRGKSVSCLCQILVTVSVVCLVSHYSNFCFCLHITFFSFACEI